MINQDKTNISAATSTSLSYHDFVIRDGQLIGNWEGLYQNFKDPWGQSADHQISDSRRIIAIEWCRKLRRQYDVNRVIEIGCGFGFLTAELKKNNFAAIGVDISETAINKARSLNPDSIFFQSRFDDFSSVSNFDVDIIVMSEITWYVLDHLDDFIQKIANYSRSRNRPTFLVHLLTTYQPGKQKYGADKFTDLDGILAYFRLNYLESGFVKTLRENDEGSQGTYFIAKI
jgi:SAM-dependent methyltransferase